jgi:glycosyltransferase involved in cell wall biosynthesis
MKSRTVSLNDSVNPLVSIRLCNYNYGRFLRECLESIINQTYPNLEINVSDNASDDGSWDIILEYFHKYPDVMNIASNRVNLGQIGNTRNSVLSEKGKYTIQMCSDDAMAPEFIEKCVKALEMNPECAFAMVHRGIIDENSNLTEEPPFYNKSCVIPGPEQAAVYIMAGVTPSVSQMVYVAQKEKNSIVAAGQVLTGKWYARRIMDFILSTQYPVVYIKDPLLLHRLHGENESTKAANDLLEIIGPYVFNHQFADIAALRNLSKTQDRLSASIKKLSQLCLRYSSRFLVNGDEATGKRYFYLAQAMSLSIQEDENFKKISACLTADKEEKEAIIEELRNEANLITRSVSYDPPPGSIEIDV